MKKLIILSAIALCGLIFNSANAQGSYRSGRGGYNTHSFDQRGNRGNFQSRRNNYHREDRFRSEERFSPERYHGRNFRDRGERW